MDSDSHDFLKKIYVNPSEDAENSISFEWDGHDEWLGDSFRQPVDGGCTVVVTNTPVDRLYKGSNGHYYTDYQVTRKLRTERWKPCIHQRDPDRQLVETNDGGLLLLTPTDDLPPWAEIRIDDGGARVVDTRRPVPK